jgi:hypothetical protein
MRRWLPSALAAVAVGVGACGGGDDDRMRLSTPPEREGAEPLPEVRRQQERAAAAARVRPTQADAERMRPILAGWARALRRNQYARATAFFRVPVIVAQGATMRLETEAQVRAFNVALPCGAQLLDVQHDGRYVVGSFRLTHRPHHDCDAPGSLVRVAFVMRGRKIVEWRQVPDSPGAPPGPPAPEDAPPPPPKRVL